MYDEMPPVARPTSARLLPVASIAPFALSAKPTQLALFLAMIVTPMVVALGSQRTV